ncbi:hypothetical protein BANRA_00016 [Klebsiella pneumoniae]|nr:hypothetical protein BANRA_00016 [Klebsiella pneumoniae]
MPWCCGQQDIIDRDIDELNLLVDDSIFHHDNRRTIEKIFCLSKFFLNIAEQNINTNRVTIVSIDPVTE